MEKVLIAVAGIPQQKKLREAMENYYGEVIDFEPGVKFEASKIYRRKDGAYYQATVTNESGEGIEFRKLGDTEILESRKASTR